MSRFSLGIATAFALVASAGIAFAAGGHTYKIHAIGGSGQNGTVTLTARTHGSTIVKITLAHERASASEPAHIHMGSCRAPGAVKYPLANVVHGSSLTIVNAPITALGAGLSVNVHQSAARLDVYKACGNL